MSESMQRKHFGKSRIIIICKKAKAGEEECGMMVVVVVGVKLEFGMKKAAFWVWCEADDEDD